MGSIAAGTTACLRAFSELVLQHPGYGQGTHLAPLEDPPVKHKAQQYLEWMPPKAVEINTGRFKAMPLDQFQRQHGRLRIWSGNLGALQSERSSLDFRLRESTVMRTNVLKLLTKLKQTLTKCKLRDTVCFDDFLSARK